ncbi:DUF4145 domain-containing protein [Burkholderia orbicola]|uniref:DUF4145 domain-containing protein n=1 Tax=Burkholderia orbicola TaxID=2978683 RepID=UPI002FE16279
MPTLVRDCPHCGAAHATFSIPYANPHPLTANEWNALGVCPACGYSVSIHVQSMGGSNKIMNLLSLSGNLDALDNVLQVDVFPRSEKIESPEHIPASAARAFDEGTACLTRGNATAAAAMFRRCLEIALKQHSPDIEAWRLEKRIDKLFSEGRITVDLKEWAHRIRLEGNDALHESEEFTAETAGEMMEFTRMVLMYLYTLPERIKLRIATVEVAKAD